MSVPKAVAKWALRGTIKNTKEVHIHTSEDRECLLYVIENNVIVCCQRFETLLYVKKCSTPYYAMLS